MLSEKARAAQREYRKRYFEAHPEAKERQYATTRQWKKDHPEKQREYIERFWERKAAEYAAEEGLHESNTDKT